MSWKDKYPLTKKMEQVWEGCAWIEGLPIHEPLLRVPTTETLPEWRKEVLERRKRVWARAEKYFEQYPREYTKVLQLGRLYKKKGWLKYI